MRSKEEGVNYAGLSCHERQIISHPGQMEAYALRLRVNTCSGSYI